MTRVSNFLKLLCAFVLAAQIHAANVPSPWRPDPDPRPPIRPPPISDPVPTTCSTSTVNIECGNNACQSAWATAFTSSNSYVQYFCSSFTSPGRQNKNKFDRKGPATACTRDPNNAAIQSSISSVCSCYAGPGVPTQAYITICPSCAPIQTQTRTIRTIIPTTITKTPNQSTKTITTIITLIIDPPPPSHLTTTTTTTKTTTLNTPSFIPAPCTTTTNINLLTTTHVTAIYDYFTWTTILTTTTTYQAGRYPCATTICTCPARSSSLSSITYPPQNCNVQTISTTTTTLTLIIDPLPLEYTITETETVTRTIATAGSAVCSLTTTTETKTETKTWDDKGYEPLLLPSQTRPLFTESALSLA